MNVLFVCSRNRRRSPTAESVFSGIDGLEVLSAGTSEDAVTAVSADLIEWADAVIAMEDRHRAKIQQRFGSSLKGKQMVVLGIQDRYEFMDEELVRTLQERLEPHLRKRGIQERKRRRLNSGEN